MFVRIRITVGGITLDAELFDTPCARAIAGALPITAVPNEWGDEFYFEIPVAQPLDDTATTSVKAGDIGYWPPGKALALFFGPTPMSSGPDPVPASAVNHVGVIHGDATVLKKARGSKKIHIERAASSNKTSKLLCSLCMEINSLYRVKSCPVRYVSLHLSMK